MKIMISNNYITCTHFLCEGFLDNCLFEHWSKRTNVTIHDNIHTACTYSHFFEWIQDIHTCTLWRTSVCFSHYTFNCPFFFQTILFVALVNGYWSDWNLWSTCTVTCDGGTRHRERTCIEPEYGGDYCLGESSETEACGTTFCPGIVWEHWPDTP